jgi:hypothetical protein
MAKTAKKPKAEKKASQIEIIGDSKYPLVPLASIRIIERPKDGEEKLFFNPRGLSSFTEESLQKLQYSIRIDGLQQTPVVRANTEEDGSIVSIELIAGERRIRSCRGIFENNLPCFDEDATQPENYEPGEIVIFRGRFGTVVTHTDELVLIQFEADPIGPSEQKECLASDVYPTVDGSSLYEHVSCKVIYECNDQRALRLAFTENDQSEPLTISEEIALVERLEKMGKKQDEIVEMIGSNVTWVSQTSNFRTQLPEAAFLQLLEGTMSRNVAVRLLSYAPEDRHDLYQATLKAEQKETAEKINHHQKEKERLEDEEELLLSDAKQASAAGDKAEEAKTLRKAASKAAKADKAAEKIERAKKETGIIKQGHVKKGAAEAGISPKKANLLDRHEIEETFIKGMIPFLKTQVDPVTGYEVPVEFAGIVRRTAMAIVNGSHDSLQPIRDYMFDNGIWERPEGSPESSLASGIDDVDDALGDIDDEDFSDGDFDPSDFLDKDVMSDD